MKALDLPFDLNTTKIGVVHTKGTDSDQVSTEIPISVIPRALVFARAKAARRQLYISVEVSSSQTPSLTLHPRPTCTRPRHHCSSRAPPSSAASSSRRRPHWPNTARRHRPIAIGPSTVTMPMPLWPFSTLLPLLRPCRTSTTRPRP